MYGQLYLFFFQAEDGIRDRTVTGVQTCALPIYLGRDLTAKIVIRQQRQDRMGERVHADVDRGKACEARELLEAHGTLCRLDAELALESLELRLERRGPATLVCGQHPLTERPQRTVAGRLSPAVAVGEAAGVLELAPTLSWDLGKQVVDPIPPVPCACSGWLRHDEHCQRDCLARQIIGRVAQQGCVRVVGRDRDQPAGAASREMTAYELMEGNDLSHLSSGVDEGSKRRQRHVRFALPGRGGTRDAVEAQNRASGSQQRHPSPPGGARRQPARWSASSAARLAPT